VNEQERADRFSEQVDRLLHGESPSLASDGSEGLDELLSLADELSQVGFRASAGAQAAFESQLDSWFGPGGGQTSAGTGSGRRDIMPGKFIALIVSVLVAVTTGAVALVVTVLVVIRMVIPGTPTETPTPTLTDTPAVTETATVDSELTSTPVLSPTSSVVPTETPTATVAPSATMPGAIDTIDAITVVITIEIEIDDLVPGMPSHGGGDHDDDDDGGRGHDGDDYHDHDRGHGNDPDHHDDDNPGRGGDDD